MSNSKWDLTGFVTASEYRTAVVQAMSDGAVTPTQLADATGIEITHVSRAVSQLREKGLVELRETPEQYRYYGLTNAGRETLENLAAVMDR